MTRTCKIGHKPPFQRVLMGNKIGARSERRSYARVPSENQQLVFELKIRKIGKLISFTCQSLDRYMETRAFELVSPSL